MPDCDDPNGFAGNAIEESVGPNDDLTMRQFGKLGDRASRFGVLDQSLQYRFGVAPKVAGRSGVVLADIFESLEELPPCG